MAEPDTLRSAARAKYPHYQVLLTRDGNDSLQAGWERGAPAFRDASTCVGRVDTSQISLPVTDILRSNTDGGTTGPC